MVKKIFFLYILIPLFFSAGNFAFADQPGSIPDGKSAIIKQADTVYEQAVDLYKHKKYAEAKKKFEEVSWVIPDYKATLKYLHLIERNAEQEQERAVREQQKILQEQAQKIYLQALGLYRDRRWEESKAQFESIEKIIPGYKRTRQYIRKNEVNIAKAAKVMPAVVIPSVIPPSIPANVSIPYTPPATVETLPKSTPAPVVAANSLEDQQKQAQDIAALSEKSAQLYRQITDIADDNSTLQTKKKMAQVDKVLNDIRANNQRLIHQMREAQIKQEQEEEKAKQEERNALAEKMYQDGQEYLRSQDYVRAKAKFLALENIIPDYKATRHYLSRIEEELKKAKIEAAAQYEKIQAEQVKQIQEKEKIGEINHIQKEQEDLQQQKQQQQEELHKKDQQQQASLSELAQKASDINDDIIRLSKTQDYEAMKEKFTELENTVTDLTALKDEIAKQKVLEEREKQLDNGAMSTSNELIAAEDQEGKIHAYITQQQARNAERYKRRDIKREQDMLFNEGVDLYAHKRYVEAKILFDELAGQHDHRAAVWLIRVNHVINSEILKSQDAEEKERTAFLQDQLKAQRELAIIQERERLRQKKLTEELERQKRLYEDDRLLQLRKEEMIKAQERERQRQEEKRLKLEKENEKKQEIYRFHKIKAAVKSPEIKPQPKPQVQAVPKLQPAVVKPVVSLPAVAQPVISAPAVIVPAPAMSPRQLEQQAREARRKAIIEAREARREAIAQARQKRIEEREKEIERRKELRAQRQADRQARLKQEAAAKLAQAQARAEKLAQEQKRRDELSRQQEQDREEKMKQDEIVRKEAQRNEELESQERQSQAQLEAQRESVRKQLEDGVEAMYQDALGLYQQGEYTAAAERFKDVQDIIPGYKRSAQYMDEAQQKSLTQKPQEVIAPASADSTNISNPPVASAPVPQPVPQQVSQPVSRQVPQQVSQDDSVDKALDIFDPNAK